MLITKIYIILCLLSHYYIIVWLSSMDENLEDYQQVDRIGRASNVMEKTPQKLLKNSEVRAAVFNIKEV